MIMRTQIGINNTEWKAKEEKDKGNARFFGKSERANLAKG